VKWLVRFALLLLGCYVVFFTTVLVAMHQTPERFGQFMRHVPQALIWSALPAPRMWLFAREGTLREGDIAPDFTLSTYDHTNRVSLSSHRGKRPVVLVFGSYT
jgi:hypothetical protein